MTFRMSLKIISQKIGIWKGDESDVAVSFKGTLLLVLSSSKFPCADLIGRASWQALNS